VINEQDETCFRSFSTIQPSIKENILLINQRYEVPEEDKLKIELSVAPKYTYSAIITSI